MGIIFDLFEKSKSKKNQERMKLIEKKNNIKNKDGVYGKSEYKIVMKKYVDDKGEKKYGKK